MIGTKAWRFVTDFGDSAVTLPLAAFCLAWLVVGARDRRAALAWGAAIACCGLAITTLKLALLARGQPLLHMLSPSGHAALATAVWGGLALMLAPDRRRLAAPACAGLVVSVAASRVVLALHTWPEVAAGLAVGALSLLLMGRLLGNQRSTLGPGWLAGAAVLVAVFHGDRWPMEAGLHHLVRLMGYGPPR